MRNNKGLAEIAILTYVIIGLALLFVPNPVSNSLGVGIRPNKTVQVEKVELLVDNQGKPIKSEDGTYIVKRSISDKDIQQHVGFLEWLMSLPILVLFLMTSGIIFPGLSLFLHVAKRNLMAETKRIVVGVDNALDNINDPLTKKIIYNEMEKKQDQSTKELVDKIQGKK